MAESTGWHRESQSRWNSGDRSVYCAPSCQCPSEVPVKRDEVRRMFDAIAPTYDLLNGVLSLGIDSFWRKRLLRSLGPLGGQRVLDIACGTGDVMIGLAGKHPQLLVGLDVSHEMLRRANIRLSRTTAPSQLVAGVAEALPFSDEAFDLVTVAFGIRNFEDLASGLREMRRVLRPSGSLRILEFSRPQPGLWGWLFRMYFTNVLPRIGRWISGHPEAYRYLPESVATFPDARTLDAFVRAAGFTASRSTPLSGGIVTLTEAER